MGRWRDGVVSVRTKHSPGPRVDPNSLCELVIDQESELVGRRGDELFVVEKHEENPPIMVKLQLEYDDTRGLTSSRGMWFINHSEYLDDLLEMSEDVYVRFKKEVATRFDYMQLSFNAYLKGNTQLIALGEQKQLWTPVTPIYIVQKHVVGKVLATLPKYGSVAEKRE